MRKQARKLWLGDWQREAQPEQDDDTVVISAVDDDDAPPVDRSRDLKRGAIAAAIAGFAVLVFVLASGGNGENSLSEVLREQTPPAQQQQTPPQQVPQTPQGAPPQGFGGPDLTGAEATKAAQAALRQFPGDIERVTRDSSGSGYVVHVIQGDGNEVHVLVDGEFQVQGSDDASGRPRNFGPGTPQ